MNTKKKKTGLQKKDTSGRNAQISSEEIQHRAYEIYQERQKNGLSGDDDSDWQTAKDELTDQLKDHSAGRKAPLVSQSEQKSRVGRFLLTVLAIGVTAAILLFFKYSPKKPKQVVSHPYVIDMYVGNVLYSHDSGTNWSSVDPGMVINEDDTLKTALNSYCDIIMTGRGIFRIQENSEIHIASLSGNIEKLEVKKGKIAINVTRKLKNNGVFEVETDVAVVSVRGTRFFIENDGDDLNVVLLEGSLKLKRVLDFDADEKVKQILEEGLEITLSPNQEVSINKEDNQKISRELSSDFKDITDIKQAREYTQQYQKSEKKKIKSIENSEKFNNEMKELNTPERLNKISARVLDYLINFETGQKALSKQSRAELTKVIALYKQNPKMKIEVQGHTDNAGSFEENMRLSKKRAESVLMYLVKNGVSRESITANGYGDSQPVADNRTDQGKWMNRRTGIKVYIY